MSDITKPNGEDVIDQLTREWKQERPELDCSAMEIVGRILKLGKIMEKRAGLALKDTEVHYTDLDVLATLRRSGKPYELSPKKLMQSVIITSGAMTALLDRLNRLGYIERTNDKNDRRIKRARLTLKGVKIIDKAIEKRFEEASNSIKDLSLTDKTNLSILLKKLLAQLVKRQSIEQELFNN
jgi:DNA-binding MarR family transcriptional regulator